MVGSLSEEHLKVRLNRLSASSARPAFRGSISEIGGIAVVKGHLSLNAAPFVLGTIGICVLVATTAWAGAIFGFGIAAVGVVSYRRERQALVATLERLLNGRSAG